MITDLAATSSLVENGKTSINSVAPPAVWAFRVRKDETRLNVRKGIFSMQTVRNDFKDRSLFNGYQSSISSTKGRLTAMGLLIRARMKKKRDEA